MIDRPTERVLHLTRKFGDETILVLIDRPKVHHLVFGIPMGVYVSKDDDGLRLKFGVKAFADEIVIDSVAVQQRRESKWSYQGPDIEYVLIQRGFLYIYL